MYELDQTEEAAQAKVNALKARYEEMIAALAKHPNDPGTFQELCASRNRFLAESGIYRRAFGAKAGV